MFDSITRLTEAETAMHFWVGEWDCYSAGTGVLAGTNTLAFRVGDKVVHESWASAGDDFAGESQMISGLEGGAQTDNLIQNTSQGPYVSLSIIVRLLYLFR